jgi:hypothetical protein
MQAPPFAYLRGARVIESRRYLQYQVSLAATR